MLIAASSLVIKHKQSVLVKTLWLWGAVDVIVRTQGEGEETLGQYYQVLMI